MALTPATTSSRKRKLLGGPAASSFVVVVLRCARVRLMMLALACLGGLFVCLPHLDMTTNDADLAAVRIRRTATDLPVVLPQKSTPKASTRAPPAPLPVSPTATSGANTPMLPSVYFLNMTELILDDVFSAAWWQSIERFLSADLDLIKNVEG